MHTSRISKKALWTGRTLSGLTVLMLAMDGLMKLAKPAPVVAAMTKLGYNPADSAGIGPCSSPAPPSTPYARRRSWGRSS